MKFTGRCVTRWNTVGGSLKAMRHSMPTGSPNMGGDPSASHDVITVARDDKTSTFLEAGPEG